MPSPFPGMDPYLENPDEWPGFHNRFIAHLSEHLNRDLPEGYYARVDRRTEIGLPGREPRQSIRPDVSVRSSGAATTAVAEPAARSSVSPSLRIDLADEPAELAYIEVCDPRADHEVVTLIELLSPSNKQSGRDRRQFLRKRARLLRSHTSIVEIDLLRNGQRLWQTRTGDTDLRKLNPSPDYLVSISRAWERGFPYQLEVFPIFLRDALPVIGIPLRKNEPETPTDLQACFTETYDAGPYRRGAIDYSRSPVPPLPDEHREWAAELSMPGSPLVEPTFASA